jgi:hypothetical protein
MVKATKNQLQAYLDGRDCERLTHNLRIMLIRFPGDVRLYLLRKNSTRGWANRIIQNRVDKFKESYNEIVRIKREYEDKDFSKVNSLYKQFIEFYRSAKKEVEVCYNFPQEQRLSVLEGLVC